MRVHLSKAVVGSLLLLCVVNILLVRLEAGNGMKRGKDNLGRLAQVDMYRHHANASKYIPSHVPVASISHQTNMNQSLQGSVNETNFTRGDFQKRLMNQNLHVPVTSIGHQTNMNQNLHEKVKETTFTRGDFKKRLQHEFKFIRDLPNICKLKEENSSVDLLILISSAVEYSSNRQSLRNSWLKAANDNTNVRYVFVLGETDDYILQQKLTKEANENNDIVIANFQDTYRNLTLKTIAGFHFANNHCAHARFIMKTDDDVYNNIPSVLELLTREDENFSFGRVVKSAYPKRDLKTKWYISQEAYPNKTYPDYYSGPGYVLSMKHVQGILNIYPNVDFIPFEDAFVGLCLKHMGLKLTDTPLNTSVKYSNHFSLCWYKCNNVVTVHGVPVTLMKSIYNEPCESGDISTQERCHDPIKRKKS